MAAERQKSQTASAESDTTVSLKDKRAEYLTARQLSEVLQISEASVHRLRRSGRIPAVLLTDRLIRFNLRDVQKALKQTSASMHHENQSDDPSPQLSFEDLISSESDSKNS